MRRSTAPTALALVSLLAAVGACALPEDAAVDSNPNDGMFRDFLDGKFDGAGHPLNAAVGQAKDLCASAGHLSGATVSLTGACRGAVPGTAQQGDLVVSARVRVRKHPADGKPVATLEVRDGAGKVSGRVSLTAASIRSGWMDLALPYASDGAVRTFALTPADGTTLEVSYLEVFPQHFGLVLSPGSGVSIDGDVLTFELPRGHAVERVTADDQDLTAKLKALLTAGTATRTTTAFRSIIKVPVGALLPDRAAISELFVHTSNDTARVELRRAAAPCAFEGDPSGTKVLLTGFQPFPADATHGNISGVAVGALRPSVLRHAQVMRLILPVEYDRAAAAVTDAIARCAPELVISFGQGGGEIALEQTAYNLKDTAEVAGGIPDNRGVIEAATPIDAAAPATRATLLPLDAIEPALVALGETPARSDDPGRYICNNVFFADVGAMTGHGRAGFIHLPYTSTFDDAAKAHWGQVIETIVQAAVDH
jgi:pyroglutamyl-peptidase